MNHKIQSFGFSTTDRTFDKRHEKFMDSEFAKFIYRRYARMLNPANRDERAHLSYIHPFNFQLLERVGLALAGPHYNSESLRGKHILDLGCSTLENNEGRRFYRKYEPWLCRFLFHMRAMVVGIDAAPQHPTEPFESYQVDLIQPGALNFLEDASFDLIHISRFFENRTALHSQEFYHFNAPQLHRIKQSQRDAMQKEFLKQFQRLLKEGGVVIQQNHINQKRKGKLTGEKDLVSFLKRKYHLDLRESVIPNE